jgi:hypothetical protein
MVSSSELSKVPLERLSAAYAHKAMSEKTPLCPSRLISFFVLGCRGKSVEIRKSLFIYDYYLPQAFIQTLPSLLLRLLFILQRLGFFTLRSSDSSTMGTAYSLFSTMLACSHCLIRTGS